MILNDEAAAQAYTDGGRFFFKYNLLTYEQVLIYDNRIIWGAGPVRLRMSNDGALTLRPDLDNASVGKITLFRSRAFPGAGDFLLSRQ